MPCSWQDGRRRGGNRCEGPGELPLKLVYGLALTKSIPFWMFFFRSPRHASSICSSCLLSLPTSWIFWTPSGPSSTLDAKNSTPWSLYNGLSTKVHSTTPFSPCEAFNKLSANRAPAIAMERVAEPAPSLALTTSSPPNWMRLTRASSFSPVISEWPVCGIGSLDLGNEPGGADDVQCGNTKESLGVIDS